MPQYLVVNTDTGSKKIKRAISSVQAAIRIAEKYKSIGRYEVIAEDLSKIVVCVSEDYRATVIHATEYGV